MEEIYADPLFTLGVDASDQEVLADVEQLHRKLISFNYGDVPKDYFRRIMSDDKEAVDQARREIKIAEAEQEESKEKFWTKISEFFGSRLKRIINDDELACSGYPAVNSALNFYLLSPDPDELVAIRARELERYTQKIQCSDNEASKRLAFDRLYSIDDAYLQHNGNWLVQYDISYYQKNDSDLRFFFVDTYQDFNLRNWLLNRARITEDSHKLFVDVGNKIDDELEGDPLLLSFADRIYRVLLSNDSKRTQTPFAKKYKRSLKGLIPKQLKNARLAANVILIFTTNSTFLKKPKKRLTNLYLRFHSTKSQNSIEIDTKLLTLFPIDQTAI